MKNILSISLAFLILLPSFSKVWIILSFKINQDQIAKVLCINRDKPEVLCGGKCVLLQRLKADEKQDKKQLPQKQKEQKDITLFFEMPEWPVVENSEPSTGKKLPTYLQHPCNLAFVRGIFHPPDITQQLS